MNHLRLRTNKELLLLRQDTRLELADIEEELAIHNDYRPLGRVGDVWVGTKDEWYVELQDIEATERGLKKDLADIEREMKRRDSLRQTKTQVAAQSTVANIVFLEDIFMERGMKKLKKALQQ